VNIINVESSKACAIAGMLSPDGKCHTFDECANGYVRGEGCGVVILKRLNDAKRDNDHIYGIIRGSCVMQDGKSATLTAPNGLAQESLLHSALVDANLKAEEVVYIEAHGTGTRLGDPIEIEAISNVYGRNRKENNPLYIGSVKANIGHLEAGAGIAGLFSVLSILQHGEIPPNCNLHELNSEIKSIVKEKSIEFCKISKPSSDTINNNNNIISRKQIIGLSSFGYSGTIGHLLMESV